MIIEVRIPAVGESISEVTMGRWFKQSGEAVRSDEVLCEIESEKATVELNAEQAGVLSIKVQTGETVPIDTVVATLDTEAAPTAVPSDKPAAQAAPAATAAPPKAATPAPADAEKVRATPLARKIAADHGVSLAAVPGSGSGGRVTRQDVLKAAEAPAPPAAVAPTASAPAAETDRSGRPENRVRMTTLRQTIARRMIQAKHTTAMLTTINEVDMSAVMALRKAHQERFQEKYGVKLGYMSFFTWAVCRALREIPEVNARLEGTDIVYPDFADVGISVSTPKGLVVPVVRNAHAMGLGELEVEIQRLAEKARLGKLSIDEMTGGTFTITNGGVFGSLISTPLINPPQSAILGMHTIQDRPVARDGQVVIRPMMYISLSYDHRIIDGKESVTFIIHVKNTLENATDAQLGL
jgi:2-oxoglutarate dehydrogenase E2 component (dihydrolipoamide succinyltransferase)